MNIRTKAFLAVVGVMPLIVGCNDGSSNGEVSATASEGVFVDAAVSNIDYKTETIEGVTDVNGTYYYESGETVIFSIGDVVFPAVTASGVVTPLDIAGVTDVEDPMVVNIIRFLQTLDTDGDPSNGISISTEAKENADENIDFDVPEAEFELNQTVLSLIAEAGLEYSPTGLVSRDVALAHFESTLASIELGVDAFVGTWVVSGENDNELLVFTFFDDGTYFHGEVDLEIDDPMYTDELNGMEWGTFELNAFSQISVGTTYFNGNGVAGLDDTITSSDVATSDGATIELQVSDDGLELTFEVTEYVGGVLSTDEDDLPNPATMTFNKLVDSGEVGTWLFNENSDSLFLMITFFADGYYLLAEVEGARETAGQGDITNKGLEWGQYTIDSSNNELMVTVMSDNNADYGLSDVEDVSGFTAFVDVESNVLTLTIDEDGDTEDLIFNRQ